MKRGASRLWTVGLLFALSGVAAAQPQAAPTAASRTDVYHVHFTKAAPGQADALGKFLMQPDQTSPMPTHFIVLRHQEGDDWDYCVIEHLGKQATVGAAITPPNPGTSMRAWHNDSFVNGPSWESFTRALGIGTGGDLVPNAIYIVGVHRAVVGHRDQLEAALAQPPAASKIQTGEVLLQHVEGGDFQFITVTRYNSWQDLGTDRSAASAASQTGWNDLRQHSAMHHDTIADRIYPK